MKVDFLLYGEYWPGSHIYEIAEILKANRISYHIFDFYSEFYLSPRNRYLNKLIRTFFFRYKENKLNKRLRETFNEITPRCLFISKGVNIRTDTIKYIKDKGCIVINWSPDDFFNPFNTSHNLIKSFKLFDLIVTPRDFRIPFYKSQGAKECFYLDWYYIERLHKRNKILPISKKEICFIGTYSVKRAKILDSIAKLFKVTIYGYGWQRHSFLNRSNITITNQVLKPNEYTDVVQEYYVNLNLLTEENFDQTNQRFYEIPAAGGLMLSEFSERQCQILKEGVECFYFNESSLIETLEYIFSLSIDSLEQVRERGHISIMNSCSSMSDRVMSMINFLNEKKLYHN